MITRPHKQIHEKLKRHSPHGVRKAKKLFSFRHPKLILLIVSVALAYYIFSQPIIYSLVSNLDELSYLGIFISGIFLAFGFSASFAIGFLMAAQPGNLVLAAMLGGLGAMTADIFIFKTIKFSFMNEFTELKKTKAIRHIKKIIKNNRHIIIKHYLLYVFAGILIATPLPDEAGVSMLAGLTTIEPKKLAIISFVLHTLAVLFIFYLGFSL